MLKRNPQEIQELLKDLGALSDRDGTLVIQDAATEVKRYYWRPGFGWVTVMTAASVREDARSAPRVRGTELERELKGLASGDRYTMKVGRTYSGKKLGRPRKYLRGDGFDV